MSATSYTFKNQKRNVIETFNMIRQEMPMLLGMIGTGQIAKSTKLEWTEDSIGPRRFTPTSNSAGSLTVPAEAVAMVKVGTRLRAHGGVEVFKVTSASGTTIVVELLAAHGGSVNASNAPTNVPWTIISDPVKEGSNAGDDPVHQATMNYNYTQIFRKDVELSRTAMSTDVYENDNRMDRQVQVQLEYLVRDMNEVLLFGDRSEDPTGKIHTCGGLYEFATGEGALEIDAGGTEILDDILVNDAVQMVFNSGGNPTAIATNPALARVIGAASRGQVQILRNDETRGEYVANVVNAQNGRLIRVIGDPILNGINEAWVLDPEMMSIHHMKEPYDWDSTNNDYDGERRSILAETTFEFNNAKLRACRIKNLLDPDVALAKLRGGKMVQITSSEENPVFTKAVTE